ncbi:MAG TPA: flagellar biosynthesis protein FlhF [Phycisphaerales bacterium]|nr:flagellar biosynthesis protein FlhF [Phycisphaerales bacterium]
MNPRTYQAASMSEALAAVKRELGRDAVILQTRRLRKGALMGLIGGRRVWEVTAVDHLNVPPRLRGEYVPAPRIEPAPAEEPAKAPLPVETTLGKQVGEIHRLVQALMERQAAADGGAAALPAPLAELRDLLLDQDVDEDLADEILDHLHRSAEGYDELDGETLRQRLGDLVADRIRVADPAGPRNGRRARVIALIGPTGVGKTTTIAKLAANYKLRENLSVGLVTIDTYRIAAVDQLRTYSQIIEVPLKVASGSGELHQAIHSFSDCDVVLIDTAGRSQNDNSRLDELAGFLSAAGADEVHLVISAGAAKASIRGVMERFGSLGADRILLTKLDEAGTFGTILNVARRSALSFVTHGQNVPDDIAPADPELLAQRIVQGGCYVA